MAGASYSLQTQAANAEALSLALQRAASVLASKSWSVRKFANAFYDPAVPGEPATSFDRHSSDALLPYVERFTPFGEGLQGYESNDFGLDQFRFEFEDLGSGQLVARWGLADIAEIAEDYETAMLQLSDCLHTFINAGLPTPIAVRQRIEDLADFNNTVSTDESDSQ